MVTIRSKILFQVTSTRIQNIMCFKTSFWMTAHPHWIILCLQRFDDLWLQTTGNWVVSAECLSMLMDSCISATPPAQPCQPCYIPSSINVPNSNLVIARKCQAMLSSLSLSFQESRVVSEERSLFYRLCGNLWKISWLNFKWQPAKHSWIPLSKRRDQGYPLPLFALS